MSDENANELARRLRKAEEAASYMEKLESLAAEAPALREQVGLLHRMEERERHRQDSLERAEMALKAAAQAQRSLPPLIADAASLVDQLARSLREVDTLRREATANLSVVDRMDYEDELDQAMEEADEEPMQRDSQSIRMMVATRHGSARVRQIIEELSPGFEVFADCELDATPTRRELTNLIMAKAGRRSRVEPVPATTPDGSTSSSGNPGAIPRRCHGADRGRSPGLRPVKHRPTGSEIGTGGRSRAQCQ